MLKIRRYLLLFIIAFLSLPAEGQEIEVVHGISISFGFPKKARFVVSYNAHLRSHLKITDKFALTPFVDLKVALYRNHLGSSVLKSYHPAAYLNTSITYGNLFSFTRRDSTNYYYVPTFASVYYNVPNNSYRYNFGVASTQSISLGLGLDEQPLGLQRVANYMLNINDFYMSYFNDGGDPLSSYFGDGKDRYWTAGLTIGATMRRDDQIERVELVFDQFTGYNPRSYETAGYLYVDNVPYSDIEQFSYNSSRVAFRYNNLTSNIGGAVNLWSTTIQDWIHFLTGAPYHSRIEKKYLDFEFMWNQNFKIDDE